MDSSKKSRTLVVARWIAQVLLGITLLYAAGMKLFADSGTLAGMWPWTADSPTLVLLTGILDALGGLGLVLPGILRMSDRWTAAAATGVALLMICAVIFHISRGEARLIGFNIVAALFAGFVSTGRWSKKI